MVAYNNVGEVHSDEEGLDCDNFAVDWGADSVA